jgi:hypothetical protein
MKNSNFILILIIIGFSIEAPAKSVAQSAPNPLLIVPDKETYSDFLMSPWKNGAPTLVAFKDPLCGYCIKALKQRARLENYNVFLFWSPIISEGSKIKVDTFFNCEKPVTDEILDAVMLRKNVSCSSPENIKLRQLNDQMMDRYQPKFVPQYWFGGQRQTFAQLQLAKSSIDIIKQIEALSSIKIPWQRYSDMALNEERSQDKPNIALVLPSKVKLSAEIIDSLKKDNSLNWFLLSADSQSNKRDIEFRMLNNIEDVKHPLYILEGKLLSVDEQKRVIPSNVKHLLASYSS